MLLRGHCRDLLSLVRWEKRGRVGGVFAHGSFGYGWRVVGGDVWVGVRSGSYGAVCVDAVAGPGRPDMLVGLRRRGGVGSRPWVEGLAMLYSSRCLSESSMRCARIVVRR